MTDHDLIRELRSTSLLNRVRQLLCQSASRIDYAYRSYRQRRHPSPIDIRRMEFEGAQEIIDLVRGETQVSGTLVFESNDPRIPEQTQITGDKP